MYNGSANLTERKNKKAAPPTQIIIERRTLFNKNCKKQNSVRTIKEIPMIIRLPSLGEMLVKNQLRRKMAITPASRYGSRWGQLFLN